MREHIANFYFVYFELNRQVSRRNICDNKNAREDGEQWTSVISLICAAVYVTIYMPDRPFCV